MSVAASTVFTCDFDGLHTATVAGRTVAPPAGWYTMPDSNGIARYFHSRAHAISGVGLTSFAGGRTTTWTWTDDYDATSATTTSATPPAGWVRVRAESSVNTEYHFKNQANAEAGMPTTTN